MSRIHGTSLPQIDLNLFRVFAVVERERSVGRAAVVLSVSQSAVSHALARLRDHLGDPLFVRHGRSVAPTPFASSLVPFVRGALGDLERAVTGRASFDPHASIAHVRVAISDELEPIVAPALYERLRVANPRITLTSSHLDRRSVRADLVARRLDVVLDVARPTHDDLAHERLLVDELCVVSHRPRRRLDKKSYRDAEHVVVSARPHGPVLEDYGLANEGIRRRVAMRCQSYDTACRVVAASDLLLTIPRRYAELRGLGKELRVFDAPISLVRVEFHQYWLQALDDDPATRWIREQVRAVLQR